MNGLFVALICLIFPAGNWFELLVGTIHIPLASGTNFGREKKKKEKKSFPMERVQFRMDHWKFKVAFTRKFENFISWLGIFVVVDFLVNFFLFVFVFFLWWCLLLWFIIEDKNISITYEPVNSLNYQTIKCKYLIVLKFIKIKISSNEILSPTIFIIFVYWMKIYNFYGFLFSSLWVQRVWMNDRVTIWLSWLSWWLIRVYIRRILSKNNSFVIFKPLSH